MLGAQKVIIGFEVGRLAPGDLFLCGNNAHVFQYVDNDLVLQGEDIIDLVVDSGWPRLRGCFAHRPIAR